MTKLFDNIELDVIYQDTVSTYKRIYGEKYPNYYPPEMKEQDGLIYDEILFLPAEPDSYKRYGITKMVGFKYVFTTAGHKTISITKDPTLLGTTTLELTANIHRIRYWFKNERTICIDKVCDPLVPPRIFNVETSSFVSQQVQNLIKGMINQWNEWYVDKDV